MWMRIVLMALCAGALWGQQGGIVFPPPLGPVGVYLQIDAAQARAILNNNKNHEDWLRLKHRRVYQVQEEIGEETKRSPLDPTALGLRYAEVEAICREIDDREKQLVSVNRDTLNSEQKLRLAALESAMKVAPLANGAITAGLIDAGTMPFPESTSLANILAGGGEQSWPGKRRTGACAPTLGSVIPASRVTPVPR